MMRGVVVLLAVLLNLALPDLADATARRELANRHKSSLFKGAATIYVPNDEVYGKDSPAHASLRCPASCAPEICGGPGASSTVDGIISARAYDAVVVHNDKLCVQHCKKPASCKRSSSVLLNGQDSGYCDELDCAVEDVVGCSHDSAFFRPSCATCARLFPRACAPTLLPDTVTSRQLLQVADDKRPQRDATKIQTPRQLSDASLVKPTDTEADTDPSEMTIWWRNNYETDEKACGIRCEEEKIRLCAIHPQTCIELRCEDLREDRGFLEYGTLCDALSRMDTPVELGLGAEEMLFRWRLYHSQLPRVCDDACELHKIHMCHLHPQLCQALRCEDAALGHGNVDVLRVCSDKSIDAALTSKHNATSLPWEILGMKEMWRLHSTLGDRKCGEGCEKFKTETCESNPMLCMELSCENAWLLLSDTSILDICDAFYPIPGPRVPPGALAVSEADLREEWAQLAVISPDCGGACTAVKMELCPQHPVTCLLLTCSDSASGSGQAIPGMAPICDRMSLPEVEAVKPSVSAARSAEDYDEPTVIAVASDWYRRVSALEGECGEECNAFKLRTCVEHDYLCLQLTCDDAARRGDSSMSDLCGLVLPQLNVPKVPAGLYQRVIADLDAGVDKDEEKAIITDDPVKSNDATHMTTTVPRMKFAGEEDALIAKEWSELVSQRNECGPDCQRYKLATCLRRPNLCIQLTCEDAAVRQDATPIAQLCHQVGQSRGGDGEEYPSRPLPVKHVEADAAAAVERARTEGKSLITLAATVDDNEFRRVWNGLNNADGGCNEGCEDGKLAMCISRIPMCVVMRCEDLKAGVSPRFQGDSDILGMCSVVSGQRIVEGDSLKGSELKTANGVGVVDLHLAKLPEFLFYTAFSPPAIPAPVEDDVTVDATAIVIAKAGPALDAFRKQWPIGAVCSVDCPWEKTRLCRTDLDFCPVMRCEDALAGRADFGGDTDVAAACEERILTADKPIPATVEVLGAERAIAFLFGVPHKETP